MCGLSQLSFPHDEVTSTHRPRGRAPLAFASSTVNLPWHSCHRNLVGAWRDNGMNGRRRKLAAWCKIAAPEAEPAYNSERWKFSARTVARNSKRAASRLKGD